MNVSKVIEDRLKILGTVVSMDIIINISPDLTKKDVDWENMKYLIHQRFYDYLGLGINGIDNEVK